MIRLYFFHADWCGKCKMFEPTVKEVCEMFEGNIEIRFVDADKEAKFTIDNGISSLPTIILKKDNEIMWKQEGTVSKEMLIKKIQELL